MRWAINIATSYLRFGTGMLTVFLMMPFIISSIGLEQFGLWSLVFAVVGLFGLLDLGFATAAVKHVAEAEGSGSISERNRRLATLLLVYTGIGFLCLFTTVVVARVAGSWFDLEAAPAAQFGTALLLLGVAVSLSFPLSLFKAVLTGAGHQPRGNRDDPGQCLPDGDAPLFRVGLERNGHQHRRHNDSVGAFAGSPRVPVR
jgi:O-antigen/teichoic acid export membrane protein